MLDLRLPSGEEFSPLAMQNDERRVHSRLVQTLLPGTSAETVDIAPPDGEVRGCEVVRRRVVLADDDLIGILARKPLRTITHEHGVGIGPADPFRQDVVQIHQHRLLACDATTALREV